MSENLGTSGVEDSSWRRRNSPIVDVGLTVRKWNVYFSGDRGQSIEAFLDKVEACRGSTSLTEEEVFQALPKLLKGVAAMRFQVEKHRWSTWSDFRSAARRWYGNGRGYQQRLLAEATARTQGNDELTRDFITCLLVIIRKMEPAPCIEMQLDMLHRNLRPSIQKLVRRSDFRNIDDLQEMAREAETTLEAERLYRPPPPPEFTILPQAAYKAKTEKVTKPKISSVEPPRQDNLAGNGTQVDQSILAAISRLEAGLNELRNKQNSRPPGESSKNKRDNYRQERQQAPPAKPQEKREGEERTTIGDCQKKTGNETNWKNNGIPELIKCWGCGGIGYRRSFCPECSGNENRRD